MDYERLLDALKKSLMLLEMFDGLTKKRWLQVEQGVLR
jgi:hypothetical protein